MKKRVRKSKVWIWTFVSAILFLVILFNLDSFHTFDLAVSQSIVRTPALTAFMIFITEIGGYLILGVLSALVFLALANRRRWVDTLVLIAGMVGGILIENVAKLLVHQSRPTGGLVEETGYSFPSGHAVMSIIFFSLLIYFYKNSIKNKIWRRIFLISAIFIALLIGFSRIYLSVHWASDVLAGIFLGAFWAGIVIRLKN